MWSKWVFIATAAAATCLMRGTVGDIVAAGAQEQVLELHGECLSIAAENGFIIPEAAQARARAMLTTAGSPFSASMLRDVERGGRTEAEQILGDLLRRGSSPRRFPMLATAYAHLRTHEARRLRRAA
jgi:2-dehydropantoate 2-reductase